MDEEKKSSSGAVVKDKRRFDAEGNVREMAEDNGSTKIGTAPQEPSHASDSNKSEPIISFGSFVVSLATQVLMQLGEMEPPPGVQVKKDVVAAKQTIDILTMLQEKTKGNLDSREAHLIEEVLHNLRMSFVRRT